MMLHATSTHQQIQQHNNQTVMNRSKADGDCFLKTESISIEYLIHISEIGIDKLLSDSRIKSVGNKTNCQIELTTRILNKRINLYRWIKYAIIRIIGPDDHSIKQCLKLLEKQFPIFLRRKEYTRKSNVTLYTEDLTSVPDNLPTSLIPPIRSGPSLPSFQGLQVKSPYEPTEQRPLNDTIWKIRPQEKSGIYFHGVPPFYMQDCKVQSNVLRDSQASKWNRNEQFELIGSLFTDSFKHQQLIIDQRDTLPKPHHISDTMDFEKSLDNIGNNLTLSPIIKTHVSEVNNKTDIIDLEKSLDNIGNNLILSPIIKTHSVDVDYQQKINELDYNDPVNPDQPISANIVLCNINEALENNLDETFKSTDRPDPEIVHPISSESNLRNNSIPFDQPDQFNEQNIDPSIHKEGTKQLNDSLKIPTNSSENVLFRISEELIDSNIDLINTDLVPKLEDDLIEMSKFELIFPLKVLVNLTSKNLAMETDENLEIIPNNITEEPQISEVNKPSELTNSININPENNLKSEIGRSSVLEKLSDKITLKDNFPISSNISDSQEAPLDSFDSKKNVLKTNETLDADKDDEKSPQDMISSESTKYEKVITDNEVREASEFSTPLALPLSVEELTNLVSNPITSGQLKDDLFIVENDYKEPSINKEFQYSGENYAVVSEKIIISPDTEIKESNLEEKHENNDEIQDKLVIERNPFSAENSTISLPENVKSGNLKDSERIESTSDENEASHSKSQPISNGIIGSNITESLNYNSQQTTEKVNVIQLINVEALISQESMIISKSLETKNSYSDNALKLSSEVSNFNMKTANVNSQDLNGFSNFPLNSNPSGYDESKSNLNPDKVDPIDQNLTNLVEESNRLYYKFQIVNPYELMRQSKELVNYDGSKDSVQSLKLDQENSKEVFITLDDSQNNNELFNPLNNINKYNNSDVMCDKKTDEARGSLMLQYDLANDGRSSVFEQKVNEAVMKISQNRVMNPRNVLTSKSLSKYSGTPLLEHRDQDCYYVSTHLARKNDIDDAMIVTNKITFISNEEINDSMKQDNNVENDYDNDGRASSAVLLETFVHNDKSIDLNTANNLIQNQLSGVYVNGVNKLEKLSKNYLFNPKLSPSIKMIENTVANKLIDDEFTIVNVLKKLELLKSAGSFVLLFDDYDIYTIGTNSMFYKANSTADSLDKLKEFTFESTRYKIIAKPRTTEIVSPKNKY